VLSLGIGGDGWICRLRGAGVSVLGSRGAGRHSMWQFAGRKCSGVVLMIVVRSAHSIGVAAGVSQGPTGRER